MTNYSDCEFVNLVKLQYLDNRLTVLNDFLYGYVIAWKETSDDVLNAISQRLCHLLVTITSPIGKQLCHLQSDKLQYLKNRSTVFNDFFAWSWGDIRGKKWPNQIFRENSYLAKKGQKGQKSYEIFKIFKNFKIFEKNIFRFFLRIESF